MNQGLVQMSKESSVRQERSIGLVLTGGTIGSQQGAVLTVSDDLATPEADIRRADEVAVLTNASEGNLSLHVRSPLRMLSENLRPRDWIPVAEAVRDLAAIDEVTGIMIFHGTDTMSYTAAALSFLLYDIDKPVVLTGSNLPPDHPGSDAVRNAHDSLIALDDLPPGTFIVFAGANELPGLVHLGTRVRKLQASGQAYATVNSKPVAEIHGDRFTWTGEVPPGGQTAGPFRSAIDPRVLALRLYPGLDFAALSGLVAAGDVHGVVIELYASATGPDTGDEYSLPTFIERCHERDIPVITTVNTTPDEPGNIYETTVAIAEAGGLFLEGMLPETATVKLMWALAQGKGSAAVAELMRTPVAGEFALIA